MGEITTITDKCARARRLPARPRRGDDRARRPFDEAISRISGAAERVRADIGEVAAVAEESLEQVSASTAEASAPASEIATCAERLAHSAGEVEELVGRFTAAWCRPTTLVAIGSKCRCERRSLNNGDQYERRPRWISVPVDGEPSEGVVKNFRSVARCRS
jgi:hypothetical protein